MPVKNSVEAATDGVELSCRRVDNIAQCIQDYHGTNNHTLRKLGACGAQPAFESNAARRLADGASGPSADISLDHGSGASVLGRFVTPVRLGVDGSIANRKIDRVSCYRM